MFIFSNLTLVGYVHQQKKMIKDGEIRGKELSEYFDKMEAPRTVWISEDGTSVVARVQYDSCTNQLIGLVLPIDDKTGIPIPFSFLANSMEDIQEMVQKEQSKVVYLVMAQPLKEGVPAFILQIFGTNNKFTQKMVTQRQKFTIEYLKKYETNFFNFIVSILKIAYPNSISFFYPDTTLKYLVSHLTVIQDYSVA